jgi:hypothetical protein
LVYALLYRFYLCEHALMCLPAHMTDTSGSTNTPTLYQILLRRVFASDGSRKLSSHPFSSGVTIITVIFVSIECFTKIKVFD